IVQESLTNVRKHARAQRVFIRLEILEGALVVRVEDDGRGMTHDDAGVSDWPRYGLAAMRERASAMGASIDWLASRQGGTVVSLAIPLGGSD
ncbi:MAG: ATP-binding protein, partial [Chloroflexota bacterium]